MRDALLAGFLGVERRAGTRARRVLRRRYRRPGYLRLPASAVDRNEDRRLCDRGVGRWAIPARSSDSATEDYRCCRPQRRAQQRPARISKRLGMGGSLRRPGAGPVSPASHIDESIVVISRRARRSIRERARRRPSRASAPAAARWASPGSTIGEFAIVVHQPEALDERVLVAQVVALAFAREGGARSGR